MSNNTAVFVAEKLIENRAAAKRILGVNYEMRTKPFRLAIETFTETRRCTLSEAAVLIADQQIKTGHGDMLVYAALADLIEESRRVQVAV